MPLIVPGCGPYTVVPARSHALVSESKGQESWYLEQFGSHKSLVGNNPFVLHAFSSRTKALWVVGSDSPL